MDELEFPTIVADHLTELFDKSKKKRQGNHPTDAHGFAASLGDWKPEGRRTADSKKRPSDLFNFLLAADDRSELQNTFKEETDRIEAMRALIVAGLERRISLVKTRMFQFHTQYAMPSDVSWAMAMEQHVLKLQQRLDDRIADHAVQYYVTLEAERDAHAGLLRLEQEALEKEEVLANLSFKLNKFSCLLEYETDSHAACVRLPPTDDHFRKVRDQVVNAVRPDHFADTPFQSVAVVDVYQVINGILKTMFQNACKSHKSSPVKTMYFAVNRSTIQRIIVHGFGEMSDDQMAMLYDTYWELERNPPMSRSRIKTILKDKTAPPLPLTFSLRSTLNSCRAKIKEKAPPMFHYIFQCKVLLHKTVQVTNDKELSEVNWAHFDSAYNPVTEEYHLGRPEYILPEHMFVYEYISTIPTPLLPHDLIVTFSFKTEELQALRSQSSGSIQLNRANVAVLHKALERKRTLVLQKLQEEFGDFVKEVDSFYRAEQHASLQNSLMLYQKLKKDCRWLQSEIQVVRGERAESDPLDTARSKKAASVKKAATSKRPANGKTTAKANGKSGK
eukprot:TRINITY_DN5107_c1_g1_i2.p1 TRINITY_DN5107_c1_g1~~TRINITY_DN5107_c1_g1_i2.p1  ORF type:complete len:560 (-),score=207.61 TRINITY_DN5107_c1_g1_i2:323-2002(-)